MTNDEQLISLARRLVACPGFYWLPGMLGAATRARVSSIQQDQDWVLWDNGDETLNECSDTPDLSDPCTRGGVLQLVRDAWGDPALSIVEDWRTGSPVWRANSGRPGLRSVWAATEAAALVAALEAAPPR